MKAFTHAVALRLVREAPEHFTAQISKAKRKGKILIDYLRNQREATAIASYSVRARPGAPVAMPLAWDELEGAEAMPVWSVREAPGRLAQPDPWRDFEASRRALTARARRRVRSEAESQPEPARERRGRSLRTRPSRLARAPRPLRERLAQPLPDQREQVDHLAARRAGSSASPAPAPSSAGAPGAFTTSLPFASFSRAQREQPLPPPGRGARSRRAPLRRELRDRPLQLR